MAKKDEGFFASVSRERKKIQWPDKQTTLQYTLLVLAISAITGVVIWLLDMLFANLLGFII
ncbi:preprotein translocase subunit SecE [Anaerococcus sp. ENR1011]|uniref:Protein translocase subunit SecE n=1 Tax=Anaerococcus groningensis TaxID=3115616 RepID=A0ABW9MYN9_9FIRM